MIDSPDRIDGETPLVSLVMPVWDPNPAWLREAVASALGQTGCAIELIVVDDGCPQPVAELLAEVEDERLSVLRVRHGRASHARNAGIEAARGSFFRFVDCDDVLVTDSTAHLLELGRADPVVVTYGATLVCDAALRPLETIATSLQGEVAEACLLNRFETTIHSLLFPRRVVEEIGPWAPELVVSQDWDYALRAFERTLVRGDRRVATYYRMHDRMNSRNVLEGIRGYRLVVDRYFERNPELRGSRLQRRADARYHVFAAIQLATVLRRYRASLDELRRALGRDPFSTIATLPRLGAIPLAAVRRRLRRLVRLRPGRSA
jgi:glycosyltransferase involved in cell wall biosynthesis